MMGAPPQFLVRLIGRNWPFANGSGRFVDLLGGGFSLGAGTLVCKTREGWPIKVMAEDHIGRHLILTGAFDRAGPDVLIALAEPEDVCVDIGANIGYVSCLLLHSIPKSTIVCFEPQAGVVDLLRHNLGQFDPARYVVVEAGLSNRSGTVGFHIDRNNRGASAIADADGHADATISLIDAGEALAELSRLDILKMDIEGHEEVTLRAAANQIERLQPKAVLYEDIRKQSGPDQAIGKIWEHLDYEVFGLKKSLWRTSLEKVHAGNSADFHDFLAISSKRLLPLAARRKFPELKA